MKDKKFTPEEIVESLEVRHNVGTGCTGCVLDEHPDYSDVEIVCRCDLEKMAAVAIRELLEENKRLREERRWIPTSERLPELDSEDFIHETVPVVEVLVMIEGATKSATLFFDGDVFFDLKEDGEFIPYRVTHWKPMPKGPEAE